MEFHTISAEKPLPSAPDAERAVINMAVNYPDIVLPILADDPPEFYNKTWRDIFEVMRDSHNADVPIALAALAERLNERTPDLLAEFAQLLECSPPPDQIGYYLAQIKTKGELRKLVITANAMIYSVMESSNADPQKIAATFTESIGKIIEGAPPGKKHLRSLTQLAKPFGEFLKAPIQPRETLIGPLKHGDLGAIVAQRGSGKTWFVQLLAHAIGTGSSLGQWDAGAPRRVGIFDSEMAVEDIHERAEMTQLAGAGDNVRLLHYADILQARQVALNLASANDQKLLLDWCRDDGIEVLILDNITTAVVGIEENDNDSFREKVQPLLLNARAQGITLIVVGHQGRNGNWRGASSKEDLLDWTLLLSADGDAPEGELWAKSTFGKFRRSREGNPPLKWKIRGTPGMPVEIQCEPFAGKDAMLALIGEGITAHAELKEELGVSGGTISKWGAILVEAGRIVKDGRSHYKLAA